jgi:hypothetical protein
MDIWRKAVVSVDGENKNSYSFQAWSLRAG